MPLYACRVLALMIRDKGTILSLCNHSGIMVRPWTEAGFECFCIDLRHEVIRREGTISYVGADLLDWLPPPRRYAMVFAFPPCTYVAVSGAFWFRDKG